MMVDDKPVIAGKVAAHIAQALYFRTVCDNQSGTGKFLRGRFLHGAGKALLIALELRPLERPCRYELKRFAALLDNLRQYDAA